MGSISSTITSPRALGTTSNTSTTYSPTANNNCTCDKLCKDLMRFHLNPSYQHFEDIYNDIIKNKLEGKANLRYWVYGVKETNPDYHDITGMIKATPHEVNVIMNTSYPTPLHLDQLWGLYFGSGDKKYMNRIKDVAVGIVPSDFHVSESATWSYKSIIQQENEYINSPLTSKQNHRFTQ